MNTLQILLIVALGISIVVGFIMKMPSASRGGARKLLANTPWLGDDSADGSLVKVTGIVRMTDHGERFMSPISKNRCVVLRIRAQVRHGVDPRAKIVEKIDIMPFVVEDESGKLLVTSEHVLLDIVPVKKSNKTTPAEKGQVLTELGYENANTSQSEIEETIVEVGARVTIVGKLQKEPLGLVGTKEQPIAIKLERNVDLANEP